jgi:hypothetical protein
LKPAVCTRDGNTAQQATAVGESLLNMLVLGELLLDLIKASIRGFSSRYLMWARSLSGVLDIGHVSA